MLDALNLPSVGMNVTGAVGGEIYLLLVGALLLAGLVVGKFGGRLGVPGLLVFLGLGMLAGSDGLGIEFSNYALAQSLGTVALCFILFQGGLDTHWPATRPVALRALSLATVGVVLTAGLMAAFAHWVLGLPWLLAWLLGAVVSSTDASAVFTVLREQRLGLKADIAPLLEAESGGNDPMAVFLTVGLIALIVNPDLGVIDIVPLFLTQMLLGAGLGLIWGRVGVLLLRRLTLQFEGLYPVLTIAIALLVFGSTAVIGGSGFLAVYIAGILIGNARFVHRRSLLSFHDGVSWLMQMMMFLTLGLLVNPSELLPTAGYAVAAALALIFVARPVAVTVSLALSGMPAAHRAMIAWVGLRGAVPIVLATFPLLAGVPYAQTLFNVVFFIVLSSVLLQAMSLPWVAGLLRVRAPLPPPSVFQLGEMSSELGKNQMTEVAVGIGSDVDGLRLMDAPIPDEALVMLIERGGKYVIPRGSTTLRAGDNVLVLAGPGDLAEVRERLRPRLSLPGDAP